MMKPLEAGKLAELQKEFPADEAPAKLTRKQKLERLATLVQQWKGGYLALAHDLENRTDGTLRGVWVFGALELATTDEVLLKDGLKPAGGDGCPFTVLDVRDYLELTTPELHEFSCDCGGHISADKMAARIRGLAESGPRQPGIVKRTAIALSGFLTI